MSRIMRMMFRDIRFLNSRFLMDYSLLLIIENNPEAEEYYSVQAAIRRGTIDKERAAFLKQREEGGFDFQARITLQKKDTDFEDSKFILTYQFRLTPDEFPRARPRQPASVHFGLRQVHLSHRNHRLLAKVRL